MVGKKCVNECFLHWLCMSIWMRLNMYVHVCIHVRKCVWITLDMILINHDLSQTYPGIHVLQALYVFRKYHTEEGPLFGLMTTPKNPVSLI